ncbi:MAG TPA: FAD-dependent oxidoreductase, partial [Candidatus Didemnitutus sp.]|nr:FAD-dependent oxidoreductase [Candidatus Didemnitutus sp.]
VGRASPRRMGRTRRSVVLPIHGMADFAGRLADGLTDVRLGWWAQSIEQSSNMWVVRSDHDVIHADRVILTVSAHSAASLVSEHDSLLGTKLSAMAYGGVRVLHCSYWKYQQAVTLHAFGALWADSGPVRGMVDLSMLMHVQSDRQFAVVFITPGATTEEAMSEVRRVFKISGEIQIDLEIDWTHAIPQYESGHLELIEQITAFEAQYPGLLLVGNYRGGVSVGDRIRQGVETSWTS